MQFSDLQKKYDTSNGSMTWKRLRYSKKGNWIMYGELIVGYDSGLGYGGNAYCTYVDAVVNPKTGEVVQHTIGFAEWDY